MSPMPDFGAVTFHSWGMEAGHTTKKRAPRFFDAAEQTKTFATLNVLTIRIRGAVGKWLIFPVASF